MAVSSLLTLAIVVWDTAELSLWRVRFILGQDLMHMSILFNLRQHTAEMTTFDGDLHYTASSMQFCKMILLISWGGGIIHPSSLHFLKCLSSLHSGSSAPNHWQGSVGRNTDSPKKTYASMGRTWKSRSSNPQPQDCETDVLIILHRTVLKP